MRLISLTFIGLCVLCVSIALNATHVKTEQMLQASRLYYQKVIDLAVEDAGEMMKHAAQVYGESDSPVKDYDPTQVSDAFFKTIFFNLNANTPEKQAAISLRIPCLVMLDEESYTLNVLENVVVNGEQIMTRITLPKRPYSVDYKGASYYLDTNHHIIYQRRINSVTESEVGNIEEMINHKEMYPQIDLIQDFSSVTGIEQLFIDKLTQDLNFYTNRHQYLARRCGVYHEFNFSSSADAWQNSLGGIGFFAMIQGVEGYGGRILSVDSFHRVGIDQADYVFGVIDNSVKYYCKMNCEKYQSRNALQIFIGAKQAAGAGYFPCHSCFGAIKAE